MMVLDSLAQESLYPSSNRFYLAPLAVVDCKKL